MSIVNHIELAFPIFTNHNQSIYLIISGVGKVKTASATTYLFMLTGCHKQSVFLNYGIAGSLEFSCGQSVLANKICDASTQRKWFPFVNLLKNMRQSVLITHDRPQLTYPSAGMLDMEGAAFFHIASTFVTSEQIQVLKIISDNSEQDQAQLNEESVHRHIINNIPEIEKVVQYLLNLSQTELNNQFISEWITEFQAKWHFTFSQRIQLKEYLRRWKIRLNYSPMEVFANEINSKNVIKKLINLLEENEVSTP